MMKVKKKVLALEQYQKVGMTILMSEKVNFKAKSIIKVKDGHFYL